MSKPGLTPAEEQQKLFEEASNVVSVQGFYMKRCLDNNKIMEALKHASNMICELRTGLLTPKNYYALYMSTFDQLRHLEQYLADGKHGRRMTELYELVQYAGNILPRLYLLITVGSVYIKSREAPAKDVLIDLVEMCRGVQHPMRGLFLRTYLSEMTKDKLPDVGNVYAESGGSVRDSIEFSLQNFTEMNKLWVRLQHHGPPSQRARREDERKDLRLLIGKNLSRLSQLEGVTVELYQELVLHRLLEQVVSCRDVIAQQYLMESLIQVFPDHFHLATLDTVLGTCAQLQPAVDVRVIVSSLIDRLAEYAARADGNGASAISEDAQVFNAFYACVNQLAAERPTMLPADLFALHCSLVGLALNSYTDQPAFVDKCLEAAATYLDQLKSAERLEEAHTDDAIEQLLRLLKLPREAYTQLDQTLSLTAYSRVAAHLPFKERRDVAMAYAKAAVSRPAQVSEPAAVTALFANVVPLLRDADDMPTDERLDDEDFAEEQNLVAGLVHLLHDDDPSRHFTLLTAARKAYSAGGARRLRYTLVPIVFAALAVARRQFKALDAGTADSWSEVGKKSMEFVHATISGLAKTEGCAELALRLFLTASLEAGRLGFESVAYEFVARAFSLYEELAKAEEQAQAITLIIATIQRSTAFGADNNDTLVAKSAQYAAKLLLKQAQARAVYLVSHLFWKKGEDGTFEGKAAVQDGKRVLECLQRSLKIADNCMESNVIVQLFVEILNRYLYYFEGGNEAVLPKYIAGLVALINTNIANMDAGADNDQVKAFYANTLAYIAAKKRTDDNFSSKLGDVDALTGEK